MVSLFLYVGEKPSTYGLPFFSVTFVRFGLNNCDWIMLTDSPTGIEKVQPILDAIWLFLLGSCRRLANAAPSPSISSVQNNGVPEDL